MKCDQCDNRAYCKLENGSLLCIDCCRKVQEIAQQEFVRHASEINMLADHMEAISGVSGVVSRYEIPRPVVLSGSSVHHIKIDNSVVGAINTGNIDNMNVALTNVRAGGSQELANALQRLTEAILASSELPLEKKTAAVEHLSHLANQAALPKEKRQIAISRTILEGFERIISASSGLLGIWRVVKPLLEQLL